ncbi:MAG TPA: TetR/AcrR family transcriptional regulator [Ktedonobacterales bacterium]|nr:TetR/AcrR family transcriptional regulator [Ktedonobacterales bacterium]
MPRSKQQNQLIKDERRRQIMDAALKIFAQKGLAATMISDIAAACGLSYGLIYHYFHDKEELYITLIERALQGTLHLTEEMAARPGTPWERLRMLCGAMVEGARDTPEYFRIMLQAQLSETPSSVVHTLMNQYGERIWGSVTALIRDGQEAGEVAAGNPDELTYILSAAIQGLSLNLSLEFLGPGAFPDIETFMRFLRPNHATHAQEMPHEN